MGRFESGPVKQRRRDISSYVKEHPSIGLGDGKIIAKALGLSITDVNNDVSFLRAKLKVDYEQYGLEGLREKATAHLEYLKELREAAKTVRDDTSELTDNDVRLKAIVTEGNLTNDIYKLECDGIGDLTEEINEKELKDELGNKPK